MPDPNPTPPALIPTPPPITAPALDPAAPADGALMESFPAALVTLLERRYLAPFRPEQWKIMLPEEETPHRPLLREIRQLGRPQNAANQAKVMPHLLNACQDPRHAVVMAVHGQEGRHRFYIGGRRQGGARNTEEYLLSQESALKAYFSGLQMSEAPRRLDGHELADLARMLQTAPALGIITGIPSGRANAGLDLQSFDCLVEAIGACNYVLQVVAEPVDPAAVDQTLDLYRRLKGEIHSYVKMSRSRGETATTGESTSQRDEDAKKMAHFPLSMYMISALSSITGAAGAAFGLSWIGNLGSPFANLGTGSNIWYNSYISEYSKQVSTSQSTSATVSGERLNAAAEACEQMLDQHIRRIVAGRASGWWQTAVYIAAESEAALHGIAAALRSVCSGDHSTLDPIRLHRLPEVPAREAIERGQILRLSPARGAAPAVGQPFDALGTCLTSEELALLVNLPQKEVPGLPMRDHAEFALSVPRAEGRAIALGTLLDRQGRPLDEVTATPATLNRHVFVTGMTGYGKTNTCMRLLMESWTQLGVPFLVVEPAKAEYRRLIQTEELATKLRVYSVGGESPLPLRLNPLSPVPGVPLGRHIDLLKAVFNASFPMVAPMPYILEESLLELFTERGWSLYTSDNPHLDVRSSLDERSALVPSLEDLYTKIDVVLVRKKYSEKIQQDVGAALRARLSSLMVGNKGMMLNTRRSTPLEDLFSAPTVIELQNLGDDEEKAFVMALVFVLLYEYAELRQHSLPPERRRDLQHMTLIEEAHRLLSPGRGGSSADTADPRGKAVSMFTDMLAEMRAYGEGFIIADQSPTKLVPETLKNSNLKIIHRLSYPDDRRVAGNCINLSDWQTRHLNNLQSGQAVIHDERIGEAVLTRIHLFKDTMAPELTPEEFRRKYAGQKLADNRCLFRHAGCWACAAPCEWGHRQGELAEPARVREFTEDLLENLLLRDGARVRARARTLWEAGHPFAAGDDAAARDRNGLVYCAMLTAAWDWVTRRIEQRAEVEGAKGPMTPQHRLQREAMLRTLGRLIDAWRGDGRDESAFREAQERLRDALAAPPRHPAPACARCAKKCVLLPYALEMLGPLHKGLELTVKGVTPANTRLESIRAAVRKQSPALVARMEELELEREFLYCLVANVRGAEGEKMEELLGLLECVGEGNGGEPREPAS